MTAVKEKQDLYFAQFAALEKDRASSDPPWLRQVRRAAIDRFAELGFPTTRLEDWKYTNVAPIANARFAAARSDLSSSIREAVQRLPIARLDSSSLVFVNGFYSPELSSAQSLPAGVKLTSLATALQNEPPLLEQHLARYASFKNHSFVALNTAFMQDGAFVFVPKGAVLEKPVLILFVSVGSGQPAVSYPRNLIVADRESQATIIEGYIGLDAAQEARNSKLETRNSGGGSSFEFPISSFETIYFTNAVTEIVAGEGAVVRHAKLQQESERAFHIATVQVEQERSSNVTNHSIALGGALVREDVNVVLGGEGAENLLNGLYVITGTRHVDNHTVIDHAKPHCNSREIYRGVLDGKSQGVFNGKIIVRKDAQKTDAKQSNKNLLLSEDAVINTKPQLEIYADDVKCTHGATVGQIDPEAVFYLRSRGIGLEEARSLLTYAFANDVLGRISYQPLRDLLKGTLFARLAKKPGVGSQGSEERS